MKTNPPEVPAAQAPPWVMASLALSMLLSSLGTSIANVALPTLALAFGASFQQVQWVVLAYLLAITTVIVSVGRLGDLLGRRRLLLAGIALFTAASALCAFAPGLGLLIAARAVQGLGAAVMMALTMAFAGAAAPQQKTGSAMGLLGTMSAVGTALGPSLGGVLIATGGWRAVFFAMVPVGLLTLLLACRSLPAERAATTARAGFDHLGTVLLALTLGAYALALTTGLGRVGPLLLAAALGLGLFVLAESKATAPLVNLALFREPVLGAGFVMSALVTTVVMATLVVGPFYLSGTFGLDAARVGLAMSCGPIVSALAGVPAGRMVDRHGHARVTLAGLVLMAIGCIALPLMPLSFGVTGYIAPLAVLTGGYALFQAANNTAVMTAAGAGQKGVIAGLLNLSRNLGLVTGASLMGMVFALGVASEEPMVAGLRYTFIVASCLVLCALGISLAASAPSRGNSCTTR